MFVLLLLPLLTFAAMLGALRSGSAPRSSPVREDLALAALLWSVAVAAGSELLGALHALSFPGVLGLWIALVAMSGLALAARWRRHRPPPLAVPSDLTRGDAFLLGGIALVALGSFLVAVLAPPQSSDSLGYHMSRVVHWIQNRTLAHYPTFDERQLFAPPLAELIRLHLLVLTGGDRAGCLLQWVAAVACLGAASLVARDLGGGRRAQLLAATFAITLPIGITQATSGKNDWVAAFWLLVFVHFLLRARRAGVEGTAPHRALAAAGAALGLALLTKATTWLFAPPVGLAVLALTPRRALRRLAASAAAGLVLALAVNAPHWWRNLSLYGDPLTDPTLRREYRVERVTPATIASNVLRNATLQLGTPSDRVNHVIERGVLAVHRFLGADPVDPRTTIGRSFNVQPPTVVEEEAGNPLHALVLLATGVALVASRRGRSDRARVAYLAALAGAYLVFCATVKWQAPNARLLLPLFVLAAPLAGLALAEVGGRRVALPLAAVLLVGSLPWLGRTEGRPLSTRPGVGVLATPRTELYFARFPSLRRPYAEAAGIVRQMGIRDVGLALHTAVEYPLWALLADGGPPVRIEHVGVGSASGALALAPPFVDFRPELVIVEVDGPEPPRVLLLPSVTGSAYPLLRRAGVLAFYARQPSGVR